VKIPAAVLTLLLASGCVTHVVLPLVPSKAAPLVERAAAYRELEPLPDPLPAAAAFGNVPPTTFVVLSNGLRVMDPVDLLPAVDASSATAQFAHAATEKGERARAAQIVSFSMEGAGLMLAIGALGTAASRPPSAGPTDLTFGLAFSGAGVALAALIPLAIALWSQFDAGIEQRSAFITYPKDLKKRLALDDDLTPPPLSPSVSLLP
jgi:hypothetical protein